MIDAFREHPSKEECVISDVFANLALAIERRRGTVYRIGLDQHFADVREGFVRAVANLEQLLDFAKLGHEVRDVVHNLRVADPNLLGIVTANEFNKQLLQRVRFRNHYSGPPNSASKE